MSCEREVRPSPHSNHAVDLLIRHKRATIAIELGTGQAERLELDILKLVCLAFATRIDYICLILPSGVQRHGVMGRQDMSRATESLLKMCTPLLEFVRKTQGLRGGATILYG